MTDRRVLGFVPARAGSKRLPGKNVAEIAGRPLLDWTLDAALDSATLDAVVVSSDDPRALEIAERRDGVSAVRRDPALASDAARNVDVMRAFLDGAETAWDLVVLLQPTCPLRIADDIDAAVGLSLAADGASCVSVARTAKSSYWLFRDQEGRLEPLLPRPAHGDIRGAGPTVLAPNGAVFVVPAETLSAGRDYYSSPPLWSEMPPERSIDIDTQLDFDLAETLLKRRAHAAGPEGPR